MYTLFIEEKDNLIDFCSGMIHMVKNLDEKIKNRKNFKHYSQYANNFAKVENALIVMFIVKFKLIDEILLMKDISKLSGKLYEDIIDFRNIFKRKKISKFLDLAVHFVNQFVTFCNKGKKLENITLHNLMKSHPDYKFLDDYYSDQYFEDILDQIKWKTYGNETYNFVIIVKKLLQLIFAYSFVYNFENQVDYITLVPKFSDNSIVDLSSVLNALFLIESSLKSTNSIHLSEIEILPNIQKIETRKIGLFFKMEQKFKKPYDISCRATIYDNKNEEVDFQSISVPLITYNQNIILFLDQKDYLKFSKQHFSIHVLIKNEEGRFKFVLKDLTKLN